MQTEMSIVAVVRSPSGAFACYVFPVVVPLRVMDRGTGECIQAFWAVSFPTPLDQLVEHMEPRPVRMGAGGCGREAPRRAFLGGFGWRAGNRQAGGGRRGGRVAVARAGARQVGR